VDARGIVVSNLAFPGDSGRPLLDRAGRVVGVVYTKIADLRAEGTPTDESLADHRTVAVGIDSRMKARIEAELGAE
jgi:S1-C subfamily serine protease